MTGGDTAPISLLGERAEGVLIGAIVLILAVSSLLTLVRIARGPSVLDRAIGAEALVAIVVCAIGVEAAVNRHATTLPLLISLSLLGFLGSVAVARFVPYDVDPGRAPLPEDTRRDLASEVTDAAGVPDGGRGADGEPDADADRDADAAPDPAEGAGGHDRD